MSLILLAIAWLFFIGGLVVHYQLLWRSRKAKEGEEVPSNLGFLPGLVGALAVFFTIPELARYGIEVPWPWLWIVLPLLIDPFGLGMFVLVLAGRLRGSR